MGGEIDWQALPVVVEMLGITDVETFLNQLIEIREFKNRG
jgi:hypothetical protein